MLWDEPSISEAGEAKIAVMYLKLQRAARAHRGWIKASLVCLLPFKKRKGKAQRSSRK